MDNDIFQIFLAPDGGRGGFNSSSGESENLARTENVLSFLDRVKDIAPAKAAQVINVSLIALGASVLIGVPPPAVLAGIALSQPAKDLVMSLIGEATGNILGKVAEGKNINDEEIRRFVRVISHKLDDAAILHAQFEDEILREVNTVLERLNEMHPEIVARHEDTINILDAEVLPKLNIIEETTTDTNRKLIDLINMQSNPDEMQEKFPKLNLYKRPETPLRRNDINKEVESMLNDPNVSIIELCGHPAVGLTELAKQIAYEFKDNAQIVPDQETFKYILFLSARDESISTNSVIPTPKDDLGNTLSRILTQISTFYGNSAFSENVSIEDRIIAVKNSCFANNEKALFIIDDIDTVDDQVVEFLKFASNFPNVKIIVTSTRPQNLGVEVAVPPLTERASKELIRQVWDSNNKNAKKSLTQNDIQRIYMFTKGLPTVINWVVSDIARSDKTIFEIEQDFNLYGQSELARYCFENLYKSLSDSAKSLLTSLSLFPSGATELELIDLSNVDDIQKVLEELENLSLIEYSEFGVICLHPITSSYVAQVNTEELEEKINTYVVKANYFRCERVEYYFQCGKRYEEDGDKGAAITAYIKGLGYLKETDTHLIELRYDLQKGLGNLQKRTNPGAAINYLEANLALITEWEVGERYDRIRIYNDLSTAYIEANNIDMGFEYAMKALNLSTELKNGKELSYTYSQLGELYTMQGRMPEAIEAYQRSIDIVYESGRGNLDMVMYAIGKIAQVYQELGMYSDAIHEYQKAIDLAPNNYEIQGPIKYIYAGLAELYAKTKRYESALEILDLLIESANENDLNLFLNERGETYHKLKQFDKATADFQLALNYSDTGRSKAHTLNNLGRSYTELGMYAQANDALIEAYAIAESSNDLKTKAFVEFNLGKNEYALGNEETALTYFEASLSDLFETNDYRFAPYIFEALAELYSNRGDFYAAARAHEQGLQHRKNLAHNLRSILYSLDKVLSNYSNALEANRFDISIKEKLEDYILEKVEFMTQAGRTDHSIGSEYFKWAEFYRKSKIDLNAAIYLYQQCINLDYNTNTSRRIAAEYQIAKCNYDLGEYQTAIELLQINIGFLESDAPNIDTERRWQNLSLNYLWLAKSHAMLGDYYTAREQLLNSLGCQNRDKKVTIQIAEELIYLGELAETDGDIKTAILNLENALGIYKNELQLEEKAVKIEQALKNLKKNLY